MLAIGSGTDGRTTEAKDGRGDWIRTSDPHTPSVMRYQAALRPDQARALKPWALSWQAPPPLNLRGLGHHVSRAGFRPGPAERPLLIR